MDVDSLFSTQISVLVKSQSSSSGLVKQVETATEVSKKQKSHHIKQDNSTEKAISHKYGSLWKSHKSAYLIMKRFVMNPPNL